MQLPPRSRYTALLGGLMAIVSLSSCSLPPSQAWQQIRQDGLFPFIANGMSAPRAQSNVMPSQQLLAQGSTKPLVAPPQPRLQPIPPVQTPVAPASTLPYAIAVNGLTGYVRTPFTNPARLVDVRDMSAGSKVVCPYTQRPFLVPTAAVASNAPAPSPVLAQRQTPASNPSPRPQPNLTPATRPSVSPQIKPQQSAPSVATRPKPQPQVQPKVSPAPAPAPKVASSPPTPPPSKPTPAPAASTPPATAPKQQPAPSVAVKPKDPAPAVKMPFGAPIPGRPGFVNSPYAEKHQLVDVTGLSIGTEVKCPYTGKLFRVPPQEQAKK